MKALRRHVYGEFQFLIGRLDTYTALFVVTAYHRFQFLIGRLDTVYHAFLYRMVEGFNSS